MTHSRKKKHSNVNIYLYFATIHKIGICVKNRTRSSSDLYRVTTTAFKWIYWTPECLWTPDLYVPFLCLCFCSQRSAFVGRVFSTARQNWVIPTDAFGVLMAVICDQWHLFVCVCRESEGDRSSRGGETPKPAACPELAEIRTCICGIRLARWDPSGLQLPPSVLPVSHCPLLCHSLVSLTWLWSACHTGFLRTDLCIVPSPWSPAEKTDDALYSGTHNNI